jgi:hypothetical protein
VSPENAEHDDPRPAHSRRERIARTEFGEKAFDRQTEDVALPEPPIAPV